MQVYAVFKRYAQATDLRVGLAIGQTNFLEEQLALVGPVALTGREVANRYFGCQTTSGKSAWEWSYLCWTRLRKSSIFCC